MKFNSYARRLLFAVQFIALSTGTTAFAQDSARLRTPRRVIPGRIEREALPADLGGSATSTDPNLAQGPGPGPIGPGPGCNLFPAPPSVGTTVDLSYFWPSPSTTTTLAMRRSFMSETAELIGSSSETVTGRVVNT